ncbi:MAG: PEP-CTERM sorting domain-containing protein [Verrucomicrobiaceae bacterium]|nr:MAG: PEP-CTERM sorting domain-containing protein [Verrucomicrobiaceae bacterium]
MCAALLASFAALPLSSASAAVLSSLDRATFQNALQGSSSLGFQNFDGLAAGSVLTNLGGVSYASSSGQPVVTNSFLTSTSPNGLGATGAGFFTSGTTATFTFAQAITAFAIDINTFATANGSYTATLDTGDTAESIFETFPGAGTGQFLGFVSSNPFTTVTLADTGFAFTLDTLVYGAKESVVPAVPEPATWAMMFLGLGFVGSTLRRQKRNTVLNASLA